MARPLGGSTPTPSAAAIAAAQSGSQEAARAASNSLKRATLAIQAQQAARVAARAALNAMPNIVPNGLRPGGLRIGAGVIGSDGSVNTNLWQGANLPTEFTDGDRVKVTVEQKQQKAILTWDTFNIGGKTDLRFDQQGNRGWVALNRVLGTDAKPSQILGNIKADGSVYVINQNGIIFGGASQVNVGALIASTAKISNEQFLSGIYSTQSGATWTPSFTDAAALLGNGTGGGVVKVEAGAQIATHAPASVTSGGGLVLLIGGEVINAGSITTPNGQTQLAAGDDFVLRRGYGTEQNISSTTRGNEIAPLFNAGSFAGLVSNDGIIFSAQGDITLAGRTIEQSGVLVASTSVNTRGTIHLLNSGTDTLGSVTLGANSVTIIIPEFESEETALNSQRDALIEASQEANLQRAAAAGGPFNNLSLLADRLDQSRIEIVTGGNVIFKGGATSETGSLTTAQGGQVAVSAGGRIFTESGSTIDVSGVRDVVLAMSANNILVNIQGNELRDSPQNRDTNYLKNADVWVDLRDLIFVPSGTGGYDGDRYYTPGGLLEVGGYLANTAHKIGEWTAVGGTITLSAPEVIAQAGSVFDISGGSIRYEGGYIRTSNFLGEDGRTYNINNARADMTFYGLGQGFVRKSERWGITEVWMSPFGRGSVSTRWEPGYVVGRDAGSLILSTPTAIFEGSIVADVIQGERQVDAPPTGIYDGYKVGQNTVAQAGTLALGQYGALGRIGAYTSDVRIGDVANITESLDASAIVPSARTGTLWLDASHLNEQKLGGLTLATHDTIAINNDLTLAEGGALELVAPVIDIKANVTAPSGSVTASNQLTTRELQGALVFTRTTDLSKDGLASVMLRSGATIDTSGVWTNALLDRSNMRGLAFVDGGDVVLRSTGNVTLEAGSRIDTFSGGAILAGGKTRGGKGGDLSLLAGFNGGRGNLTLNGAIAGYGVEGGGALSLSTASLVVIGDASYEIGDTLPAGSVTPADVTLTEALFIPAGTPLPATYNQTVTTIAVGATLPTDVPFITTTVAAEWVVPAGAVSIAYVRPGTSAVVAAPPGTVIPAGSTVRGYSTQTPVLPGGYVLPANAFPTGLRLTTPQVMTYMPGTPAPVDVTIAAGTMIRAGTLLPAEARIEPLATLHVANDLLSRGFSKYSINGQRGLLVASGAAVAPVMPVYRFTADAYGTPNGSNVFSLWLPEIYTPDPVNGTLTQRGGVNLELLSGSSVGMNASALSGGGVTIAEGASITVDPGRKVSIASGGQITIDGTITAHGGEITVLNTNWFSNKDVGGLSVWIGEHARLDASARAVTAVDIRGQLYGVVPDGGKVVLGSLGGEDTADANAYLSSDAYVVVREGAVIDVSGASAPLDVISFGAAGQSTSVRRTVASNGGSIVLDSYQGIYNDGTLLAHAGGAGASGGTLTINFEAPIYGYAPGDIVPSRLQAGRALRISQTRQPSALPAGLKAGAAHDGLRPGYASLSDEQVAEGGFDNLSLFARTAIVFEGDVNLTAGRSIALRTSGLYNSVEGANATVSAPYVMLDGQFLRQAGQFSVLPSILPVYPTTGTLTVHGGLIDIVNRMNAHVAKLTLDSDTDLRFLAYNRTPTSGAAGDTTALGVTGDLDLIARRIYPTTGAKVQLYAGAAIDVNGAPPFVSGAVNTSTITIGRHDDAPVAAPYSVFGSLNLTAGTIRQGGNLLAPLGAISLAADDTQTVTRGLVEFLPGSLTSVSAKGLVIPYGGTVDGVSFTVDGSEPVPYDLLTGTIVKDADGNILNNSRSGRLGITVTGTNVVSHTGSVLDLSGGGTLAGAAFVSGRGGSVDALVNALADANPGYSFSKSGNPVYAIVPGAGIAPPAGGYSTAWTGAAPGIGEQITIPAGVPGLPAGTYTLLPANYALLPGGYRIELGARGTTGFAAAQSMPNGSYMTSATRGVANTSISDALLTRAIVTPGATLRTYSQYNEQGYEAFQLAQAATFGVARPLMAVDGKFLTFNLSTLDAGSAPRVESALIFDGFADFTPGKGGYGGTLGVSGGGGAKRSYDTDMVITGAGSTTVRSSSVTTIAASEIADVGAPNLYVGSAPGTKYSAGSPVFELTLNDGLVRSLTLESGVVLTGSQVILAAQDGGITVKSGASVNTLGHGLTAPDTVATGILFSAPALLVVSNGSISLEPYRLNTTSRITLEDGSSLYSEGSIAFTAGQGVVMQDGARFGTRDLELALPYINIGTAEQLAAAAAAGILPGGLSLDQALLDRLVQGDPATGAPGMKNLILAAGNSVNFYGSVNLSTLDENGKSVLESFVLSTPAIYGHGSANDSVTLTTDRLVWSSRSLRTGSTGTGQPIYSPAAPGAIIANGPGTGHGVFNVDAREIAFGYLEHARPLNTVQFNRLMLGFETVNLNASQRITSNNINTFAVWQTGANPTSSFDAATYRGEQATLNLVTPLLTADSASTLSIYAGGALRVVAPQGAPAGIASVDTLGATINLASVQGSVLLDTAVGLPSGKLKVTADQTIEMGDGARIDLAGRAIPFKDVTKYSWGGDVILESAHSSIVVHNGATFDVSAVNNHAGSITLSATDGATGGGIVFVNQDGTPLSSLDGIFKGSSTTGYESGSFKLGAHFVGPTGTQSENFARINTALNAGGFFQTREFAFKQGDLAIGNEVKARNVVISVDNGSLTVNGRIDASGAAPGSIRLSAKNGLTLASTAVLDVHGTELQTDSDGVAIEAKNRGRIELTATTGWLRLNEGATLDLRSPDGAARGKIVLNARRTSETGGDAQIDAASPLNIQGTAEIALNAFWSYSPTDADGSIVQDNGSSNPVGADGVVGLNQIGARNAQFINAALANSGLAARTAGLSAYGDAYHLRPGVEIDGRSSSNGNLTVKGNLDLASLRTSDETYSATESGSLVIRAPGNLTVNGSITDGFGNPVANPNDIKNINETLTSPRTLTEAITSGASTIPLTETVTFDFIAGTGNSVQRGGVAIPFEYTGAGLTVRADMVPDGTWTLTGSIKLVANLQLPTSVPDRTVVVPGPGGTTTYRVGDFIPAGTILPVGTKINIGFLNGNSTNFILPINTVYGAGTTLPRTNATTVGTHTIGVGTVIPKNINLAAVMGGDKVTLQAGQTLPVDTLLPAGMKLIAVLPITNHARAPMLAPGSQSWSIRLVSGADSASADTSAVQSLSVIGVGGNMLLSNSLINAAGNVLPSVIRTGTGDLDLIAGRDLTQDTSFGIYTAGTQIDAGGAYSGVTSQSGYFTEGAGDLTITAGRNLTGSLQLNDVAGAGLNSYSVGNWLVRQGDAATPAAWGIRFGAYGGPRADIFYGFSGFGTLGGGNLAVDVGGDAGVLGAIDNPGSTTRASTGLVFAVGGSGRVTSVTKTPDGVVTGGTLLQTGGGDLSVDIGGRLNPSTISTANDDLNGSFTNLRGDIAVKAGAIGSALLAYGVGAPNDPRAVDLYRATMLQTDGGVGGPVVVIGDGSASLQARGDLVFGGAGDPGMIYPSGISVIGPAFSLWRSDTAITLLSAGGNMVPLNLSGSSAQNELWTSEDTSANRAMLPPIFEAVAAQGSLYWAGRSRIELAPSREGYLELLAGDSIHAAAFGIGSAGTNASVPAAWIVSGALTDPNSIPNPFRPGTSSSYFQFQPDTVTTNLHEGDDKLIRVYALTGDIVNFTLGDPTPQYVNGEYLPRYRAAMPARIYAGRDIVNFGKNAYRSSDSKLQDTPSLILNNDATDVSIIEAGRDILYAQVQVAGPGSLEVVAGRNLYLGDKGSIVSIGPVAAGDSRPGASILMQAGAGAAGPNYAALHVYLDPANLAVTGTPLADQPGKVAKTYEQELRTWLKERFGYDAASDEDRRAYFATLAPEQQRIFLRGVYFAELKAGGREYNDPASSRFGSYLRGRDAIAALFPDEPAYDGNITIFGGSGVRTEFGGDIQMLTPGGQQVVGLEGVVPPASAGIVTQGAGNIQMYSKGSILLGLSRIMTTMGGDVLAWSAEGDINAGRGAKTTIVYTPARRVYDDYGNVTLSPNAPSSGAGIASRSSIPGVPGGSIDLIAPLGTIDAGEAGIRSGADVNIAALHIVNAANISAQGTTTGVPQVQAPNIGGLTEASNTAGAAAQQAATPSQGSGNAQPSIIIVEVLGFGGGTGSEDVDPSQEQQRARERNQRRSQNPDSPVQVVGAGYLDEGAINQLTPEERKRLVR
ncbi:filamentous hemagglutinin N-terminal domain-containing protein [Bradyrhizobium sp. CSA112]|uniref:filamentous haemagglutinin family protein n=1 Tax=Bradyrhizobium sp. CSA112 TaxID=2699170 RepID=UPI0023B11BDB|nr:filamentous haemagglutinin family protein [Bradyrhizobium sp. CSA112]MDE5457059.1 filamentous hemagglutinin N-terminal domain-containing protein [Bradyrhizobium sp. CSA112]